MNPITIHLPWPPSINNYYHHSGRSKAYLSARGRAFRDGVALAVHQQLGRMTIPENERLAVDVTLCAPDKRKRDIDNHIKAVFDALQACALIVDDASIDRLLIERGDNAPGGACTVTIRRA